MPPPVPLLSPAPPAPPVLYRQATLFITLPGAVTYRRTLLFAPDVFEKLCADFLDYQRDRVCGVFRYECLTEMEQGNPIKTSLLIDISLLLLIA